VIGIEELQDVKGADAGIVPMLETGAPSPPSPTTTPDDGGPPPPPGDGGCAKPSKFNLTGHWRGSFTQPEAPGLSATGDGNLVQTCDQITGDITLSTGLPFGSCIGKGNVTATVDDNGVLKGTLFDGVTTVDMTARADGNDKMVDGKFTVNKSAKCNPQGGDFSVTKQ
jgi:hypothetical protein